MRTPFLLLAAFATSAFAQAWPERPVTFIVPIPPARATDRIKPWTAPPSARAVRPGTRFPGPRVPAPARAPGPGAQQPPRRY